MMKLRPRLMEPGKAGWGGLETWIPVGLVVAAVVLNLLEVIPAWTAAIAVAVALLFTMSEPIVRRSLRSGQFPGWARAAAGALIVGSIGWAGTAAAVWAMPAAVVAEGDITTDGEDLPIAPEAAGETRDYTVEVTATKLPEKAEPVSLAYRIRVGREEVSGSLGKEFRRRRFLGGSKKLVDVASRYHRLRTEFRAADRVRAAHVPKELPGPIHVTVREAPFTRLTLILICVPLLLGAAIVEAFEERSHKERSRLTMLVGGILAATVYFLVAVRPDDLLIGVLGSAIAGLAGALASFVLAAIAAKVLGRAVKRDAA